MRCVGNYQMKKKRSVPRPKLDIGAIGREPDQKANTKGPGKGEPGFSSDWCACPKWHP